MTIFGYGLQSQARAEIQFLNVSSLLSSLTYRVDWSRRKWSRRHSESRRRAITTIIFHVRAYPPFVNGIATRIPYCVLLPVSCWLDRRLSIPHIHRDRCVCCVRVRARSRVWISTSIPGRTPLCHARMHPHTHTHTHAPRIFGRRALKLSLYFIGRAYKSKASTSQILEALHTPIRGRDAQNADTCLSIDARARARVPYLDCLSRLWTKSRLLALRIIISPAARICEGNYVFLSRSYERSAASLYTLYMLRRRRTLSARAVDADRVHSAARCDIFGN